MRCLTSDPQKPALSLLHMLLDYKKKVLTASFYSSLWNKLLDDIPRGGVQNMDGISSRSQSRVTSWCNLPWGGDISIPRRYGSQISSHTGPAERSESFDHCPITSSYCRSEDGSHHLLIHGLSPY